MIVIVFGLPGSGKSYFARALALRLNGLLISSDAVRRQMNRNGKYDDEAKTAVYLKMLSIMESGIKEHKNVVLDATFYKAGIRRLFKEKATELGEPLNLIEISAAEDTIKTRVASKRTDSEADFGAYLEVKQAFEPLTDSHLVLYSDREALDQMLAAAITYLNAPGNEIA